MKKLLMNVILLSAAVSPALAESSKTPPGMTPEMMGQAEHIRQMNMRCDKSITYDIDARKDEKKMHAAAQKCKADSDMRTCVAYFGKERCQ